MKKQLEVWSAAVNSLPSKDLKSALNGASDTLPHNSNLSIWRRREGLTDSCKLCGRKQTLLHILNDCPVALELRRYNQRQGFKALLDVLTPVTK